MSNTSFLMQDVYDYLMENDFSIGTNFVDEFPKSWIDEENGVIYLAKKAVSPFIK
jgi:hypothetical protein